jgi:hypothetical protein
MWTRALLASDRGEEGGQKKTDSNNFSELPCARGEKGGSREGDSAQCGDVRRLRAALHVVKNIGASAAVL